MTRQTIALALLFVAGPAAGAGPEVDPVSRLRFALSFPAERSGSPLDGRMLLLISADDADEPRFQINDGHDTQQVFGTDVVGLAPGAPTFIGSRELGYPLESLAELPAGEYWVQGLLHRYETFHRADGHTVRLPMDRGEGQHWNRAPGHLQRASLGGAQRPSGAGWLAGRMRARGGGCRRRGPPGGTPALRWR